MFRNNDYTLIQINSLRNGEDVFFYLWIFMFLPVLCSIIFTAPLYYAFKLNNKWYFIISVLGVIMVEYLLYTYTASQTDLTNGIYNGLISLLLLTLLFFKDFKKKLN